MARGMRNGPSTGEIRRVGVVFRPGRVVRRRISRAGTARIRRKFGARFGKSSRHADAFNIARAGEGRPCFSGFRRNFGRVPTRTRPRRISFLPRGEGAAGEEPGGAGKGKIKRPAKIRSRNAKLRRVTNGGPLSASCESDLDRLRRRMQPEKRLSPSRGNSEIRRVH